MAFDAVITHPGRLKILTTLARQGRGEFVDIRRETRLTDGNLASHARRLMIAGFIHVDKQFRAGKPVTSYTLTRAGRAALESHVNELLNAMRATDVVVEDEIEETWVD